MRHAVGAIPSRPKSGQPKVRIAPMKNSETPETGHTRVNDNYRSGLVPEGADPKNPLQAGVETGAVPTSAHCGAEVLESG